MKILADSLAKAFQAAGIPEHFAVVTRSDRPDLADFQCNGALVSAKQLGKSPRDIAQTIINAFDDPRFDLTIAGPGFINARTNNAILEIALRVPQKTNRKGQLKIIDYGGPNVAKAMHVGHLRSLVIGKSLREILVYQGYDVITDIHWGDWGYQMGLVLAALMYEDFRASDGNNYTIEHLQKIYPLAADRAKNDEGFKKGAQKFTRRLQLGDPDLLEIWGKIVEATQKSVLADLEILNIKFDLYNGESNTALLLPVLESQLMAKDILKTSEGAEVIYCKDPALSPLMFTNSEGGYLYAATDLATIQERAQANPTEIIYVVDQRQGLHFRQVFDAAKQMGHTMKLTHAGFGTIQGFDGKPFRTRAGGVPKLRDLLDEAIEKALAKNPDPEIARKVAIAAIKFNDLQNKRSNDYAYDIDRALAHEGKTGPYLLYQLVRMKSILDKQTVGIGNIKITCDEERQIVLDLLAFSDVMNRVEDSLSPHLLAEYLYTIAQKFSAYYGKYQISTDPSRVGFVYYLHAYLETGLGLLGIETVEEM
jgi:arginyl-tRNA synthetase